MTVVIPTCDRPEQLDQCLACTRRAIDRVGGHEVEAIVADDGPAQLGRHVVESKHPWATWVEGPRRGPAANRNRGAAMACGVWLVFTDDDCLPESGWLAAFAAAMQGPGDALEGSVRPLGDPHRDLAECPVNEAGGQFWSANVAVRKATFDKVGGFDERYPLAAHEDEDLHLRLLEVTAVRFVREAAVGHPVRVVPLGRALRRIVPRAHTEAIYYRLNRGRLKIPGFGKLVLWIVMPHVRLLARRLAERRWGDALVEAAWLGVGAPAAVWWYLRLPSLGDGRAWRGPGPHRG